MILSKSKFFRRIETILSDRRGRIKKLTKLALAGTVVAATVSLGLAVMLPLGCADFERAKNGNALQSHKPESAQSAPDRDEECGKGHRFGPRTFNSEIPLYVNIRPIDMPPHAIPVGQTPSDEPLQIPKCRWWYIGPKPTGNGVNWEAVANEIADKNVPGLVIAPNAGFTDAHLANLKGLRSLKYLSLRSAQITKDCLISLRDFEELQVLHLGENAITNENLFYLVVLDKLQELWLTSAKLTDEGLAHLRYLQNLETLVLKAPQVTAKGLRHLKGLRNLIELHLFRMEVQGDGLAPLQELDELQKLYLVECGISDRNIAQLAKMKSLEGLRVLMLAGADITDEGLRHLEGFRDLRLLDLRRTKVTDKGFLYLRELPNLETLRLFGNPNVSSEGVTQLKERLPDLTVLK